MSEIKTTHSTEETLHIQTLKLGQQLQRIIAQDARILELESERDALAAQVEALRNAGNEVYEELQQWALTESHEETSRVFRLWLNVRNQPPAACLAQVQIPQNADDAAAMALLGTNWLQQNAPERLTEYMNQVRAEAVNEFLHILEHAPSSPVSARTALGVSQWWVKFEAAKKQGGDA